MTLSYHRAPASKRRAISNAAVVLGFILSCSVLYEAGPRIWESVTRYYWKRQAKAFTLKPGTVVLQEQIGASGATIAISKHPEPAPWTHLCEGRHDLATFFLHERIAKSGEPVLVEIDTDNPTMSLNNGRFWGLNIRILSAAHEEYSVFPNVFLHSLKDLQSGEQVQFFWGEPDKSDPSHCTISFASKKRSGVIDVWIDSPVAARAAVR
jgi:hypothetical protein